ncbi:MAG: T9SS type A sorting domain-containing protein [Bacteroidales bacterium]|nr:T9SS type A sorting domain-containing protein [Bacteroidales bacterium]
MINYSRLSFILLLLFYSYDLSSQNFWQLLGSCDTATLRGIKVDSFGRIYIGSMDSDYGGFFRSDDNGQTWQSKSNGMQSGFFRALTLGNDSSLFVSSSLGVYRSIDLGEHWQLMYDASMDLEHNSIEFGYDSVLLLGGGRDKAILRSVDGGVTWENVLNLYNPLYYEYITDFIFGPNQVIYACSRFTYNWSNNNPKVYYSTDNGNTWSVFFDPYTECGFETIEFDNLGRLLIGGWGGIYRYDFSTTIWEHISLNTIVSDIFTVSDGRIFLACDPSAGGWGGVLQSVDSGNTYSLPLNSGLNSLNAQMFACDYIGRLLLISWNFIYYSNDTIFTPVPDLTEENICSVTCYPNPFKDYIIFQSNINDNTNIEIFKTDGKLIQNFVLGPYHEQKLPTEKFLTGLYIVSIEVESNRYYIKLIHY